MTDLGTPLLRLEKQLWTAALADPVAPEQKLALALQEGASYGEIKLGLRKLWRMALPGAEIAAMARRRWPNSIDMALLALELGPPESSTEGLAHLTACVTKANRRRAALANACLRLNRADLARDALAQIDPHSQSAADDIQRRAELALVAGDFVSARVDIDWLDAQDRKAAAMTLHLQLVYRKDGARVVAATVEQAKSADSLFHAQAFDIFLNEGDYSRAGAVLECWQAAPDASDEALTRAQSRFALERGDAQSALAMLEDRLDKQRPWGWDAADHLQWLRAGLAVQADPVALLAHAASALRIYPRHDGLAHVVRLVREAGEDWNSLEPDLRFGARNPSRMEITARAALRMGLSGRAMVFLAQARRAVSESEALRLHALRSEAFLTAGRRGPAYQVLRRAQALATDAVQKADLAVPAAELWLARAVPEQATAVLASVEDAFPDRMQFWLIKARICFQKGDFAAASRAVARFNALKAAQIGQPSMTDLRDRITDDAAKAAAGVERAFQPHLSVTESISKAGFARIAASSGLSACLIARAHAKGQLDFQPDPGAVIPRRIAHYWQGPHGPALARATARWRKLHPEFDSQIFDAESTLDWLRQNYDIRMVNRFSALSQPAARADLFRLCWIVRVGGVFADLDEYPRIPVTPWLEDARAVFCVERGFGTIANNFIAAEPSHPICLRALDYVCQALDEVDTPYAWWHSGPAQWTRAVFAVRFGESGHGLRILSQEEYGRRVATNLPYPHKRSPEHWR